MSMLCNDLMWIIGQSVTAKRNYNKVVAELNERNKKYYYEPESEETQDTFEMYVCDYWESLEIDTGYAGMGHSAISTSKSSFVL